MRRVFVHGLGAVSPAGWGVAALREAVRQGEPWPCVPLQRPGWEKPLHVRPVPPPAERLPFLSHPRLRRASALTQHAVAAALEALGSDLAAVQAGTMRLRLVVCLMPGCVTYSRRFYEEVLHDPATASPLLFPETVFNAPASHLAAFCHADSVSYTLVGDGTSFLQGLALAASWLIEKQADGCLVVAAEEMDWIVADAMRLFTRQVAQSAGAGALYLRADDRHTPAADLVSITDVFYLGASPSPGNAVQAMRAQLPSSHAAELLCLGTRGAAWRDADELAAWQDWKAPRLSPGRVFGEAFTASAAWQCVAACDALRRSEFQAANVSVIGANRQAIGARFAAIRPDTFL